MAEQFNKNKRFLLPPEDQVVFLSSTREALNLTWAELSRLLKVHPRRMSDWKNGKGSVPLLAAQELSMASGIPLPRSGKIVEQYWNNHAAATQGGNLMYEKYGRVGGDPTYRKDQWKKWWSENDKKNNLGAFAVQREILKPALSKELAELVGIILGDGGITKRQLKITLDSENDALYASWVVHFLKGLFGVSPSTYKNSDARAVNITISRTSLITFLGTIGLRARNKVRQQVDIPLWVKENPEFSRACVRGLMDTDGCIFIERHIIRGKIYTYRRMSFVNHSIPLLKSVQDILRKDGFEARLRGARAVTLEKPTDVIRYFTCVGSHNPKHVRRFNDSGERV